MAPGRGRAATGSTRRRADGPAIEHPRPGRDPFEAARELCLELLTRRPHTRAELEAALAREDVPAEAADAVLGRLSRVGLVDDAAFAAAWVASHRHRRGLARRALAYELRRRGVDAEDVAGALAEIDTDAELAMATDLVRRRLPSLGGRPPEVRARRLVAMLARKGYPAAIAHAAVRDVLRLDDEQHGLGDPDDGADDDDLDDAVVS